MMSVKTSHYISLLEKLHFSQRQQYKTMEKGVKYVES